jgi:hypothetical protein
MARTLTILHRPVAALREWHDMVSLSRERGSVAEFRNLAERVAGEDELPPRLMSATVPASRGRESRAVSDAGARRSMVGAVSAVSRGTADPARLFGALWN